MNKRYLTHIPSCLKMLWNAETFNSRVPCELYYAVLNNIRIFAN